MKMAASEADWSKRLIKTREGEVEEKGGWRGGEEVEARREKRKDEEKRRETSIGRAYNIIFIFRTKDVIS